ncbi:MAG: hypothetical protein AAGA77_03980 [Bacteroidota bacterium]
MNLKKLIGTAFLLTFLFSFQSCTNDVTLNEEDEKREIREISKPIAVTTYCRYNVTNSTAESVDDGDIVCFACVSPCADAITNKPFKITVEGSQGQDSIIIDGYVSGDGVSSSGKCKKCPSDGKISS